MPLGTATISRTDLVTTQSYRGILSYPSRGTVHLTSGGTITSLPRVGDILARDHPLLSVDDQPVGVLFGSTPLYRTLKLADTTGQQLAVQAAQADLLAAEATRSEAMGSPDPARSSTTARSVGTAPSRRVDPGAASWAARNASIAQAGVGVAEAQQRLTLAGRAVQQAEVPQRGPDVALVANNLASLGYYHGSTDTWTAALQDAVGQWQRHLGMTDNGEIDPSRVLVVRTASRVGAVEGRQGDAASAVTISLSSPSREATFQFHDGVPAALALGRRVRVSAAGGRRVTGHVASVTTSGRSATVRVNLDQQGAFAHVSSTRVSMSVTTAARRNVLAVPIQALLALASGGYALQLPDGWLLAVRTGAVQAGNIEVSGAGIHAGLRVVSAT